MLIPQANSQRPAKPAGAMCSVLFESNQKKKPTQPMPRMDGEKTNLK
jgi:hypothetical protein